MRRLVLFGALLTGAVATAGAQPVPEVAPVPGTVITQSVRVKPGVYDLPSTSLDRPILIIRGNNITVDFTGVELRGASPDSTPDAGRGLAVLVDSGSNIRVRNLRARGYWIGIMARGVRQLTLENNDLSHTWKPRLFSLVEHESLIDWMSFHQNERREWLRFGAGIYLEDVDGGTIRGNTVQQSMNGLLMTRSDSLVIRDNDFSFNSALGIGMYRSSYNVIVGNRVDYNVRGYSHGFFRRGQDSAGILMYEQSSNNIVAWNSVSHGGDGLFLWAGQHTMDTGMGGANDNLFFANDFSYAPTNGMEATFSRNRFIANRVVGNDHGLWGGYSYESVVEGNCFALNRIGIAIEHGQQNVIVDNRFDGDSLAFRIWANTVQPSDWGYPKHRDTRSRDYLIRDNVLAGNKIAWRIDSTHGVDSSRNRTERNAASSCTPKWDNIPNEIRARFLVANPDFRTRIPSTPVSLLPRSEIIVDEWGPFDWRSPKLWPVDSTRAVPLRLRVLGPAGTWRVVTRDGIAAISRTSGRVGDTISVTPDSSGSITDWNLELDYRGERTVMPNGTVHRAGTPVRFGYSIFEPRMRWTVQFHEWTDSTNPHKDAEAFARQLQRTPLVERIEPRLDYMWYRPTIRNVPQSNFATVATTTLNLPEGTYTIRTISDDAIRVWVDERLVIDNWSPHGSAVDYATITGGRHRIRVHHVQVGGWTELRFDVLRGEVRRSMGSAGPH